MIYLIQGVFFQKHARLAIAQTPTNGATVIVENDLLQFLFSAVVQLDPTNALGGFSGQGHDYFGQFRLNRIFLGDTTIEFTKKYNDREDGIEYRYPVKKENIWTGEYNGELTGQGVSRCILTEVPNDFFSQESITTDLGQDNYYQPPT